MGALGKGSGRDLRVRPQAAASGNLEPGNLGIGDLGTWKSRNLEIWGPGNPEMWGPTNGKNTNYQNPNPFCPKGRQDLD